MGCVIAGCGKAAPSLRVSNDDLAKIVETDDEWIVSRTGIRARRIATTQSSTDLAAAAALRAMGASETGAPGMESTGWNSSPLRPEDIDLVICMTITPDALIPNQASLVKARLGLSSAIAFDLNAACSGCVFGLVTAERMMTASALAGAGHNAIRRALVIGVERLSRIVDWGDRSTCVLFGDGAGAVLLEWDDAKAGIIASHLTSIDDANLTLKCANSNLRVPPFDGATDEALNMFGDGFIGMEGQPVFKFATAALAEAVELVCREGNVDLDEVSCIIPHQANERIIKYAAKKMGMPLERFQVSTAEQGNTSAASALMALTDAYAEGRITPGHKTVMAAFGGGLSAGAVLFEA